MSRTLIVIPARLEARRLPCKPLQMIGGEPLIRLVARQVVAMGLEGAEVVVATDSDAVAEAVDEVARVMLTSRLHRNGTERVAEVARLAFAAGVEADVVVNVQGDMPFVPREAVTGAIARVEQGDDVGTSIACLPQEALADFSRVKVTVDDQGRCQAFHRRIAWGERLWYMVAEHVGVYAYRPTVLQQWAALPPSRLERVLGLEQVRAMEAGVTIGAAWLPTLAPLAIDTEEDLERARRLVEVVT